MSDEATDQDARDPLPSLLPPEGAQLVSTHDLCALHASRGTTVVSGAAGSAAARIASALAHERRVLLVGGDLDDTLRLWDDVGYFAAEHTRVLLLAPDTAPYAEVNPDRRAAMARLATLTELAHASTDAGPSIVVVNAAALVRKWVPRAALVAMTTEVIAEDELDRDAFVRALADAGYLRVPLVEDPGTFAVRGALCDVWPVGRAQPVRFELYGDLVTRIESFDAEDQKTRPGSSLSRVRIPPAREGLPLPGHDLAAAMDALIETVDYATQKANKLKAEVLSGRSFFGADAYLPAYYTEESTRNASDLQATRGLESLFAYLSAPSAAGVQPEPLSIVLEDGARVALEAQAEITRVTRAHAELGRVPRFAVAAFCLDLDELDAALHAHPTLSLVRTARIGVGDGLERLATREEQTQLDLAASDHADLADKVRASQSIDPLLRRLRHYREHGLTTTLVARTEVQAERLRSLLAHRGIKSELEVGSLARGLVLPGDARAYLTEQEIFGGRIHKAKRERSSATKAAFSLDMRSLATGDLVVHVKHGIGRYLGLVQRALAGVVVDLLAVEYAGGKLYLPVYQLNQIQKYAGGDATSVKLDRLGGLSFAKTKARVKKAAREMADELLRLYAERATLQGPPIEPIDDDYRMFEAGFAFEETADQAKAIDDVQSDLSQPSPMDRLVCGDVGFGKTEVALRAAFRVASSGKQVALLCPTTVLAEQHFRTFEGRMAQHGLNVRVLSRFASKRAQTETLTMLKDGRCDVVVGTHRLLSKDVHFKDLGLLVIDEEQRFGVAHKERIKQLRKNVHILTLSATPIPRTLQMAVSGVRELSLITTPPVDRRAVRTIVTKFDERVIHDAITREMERGGQVFYVHGRIEALYERAQRIKELVPNARVAVAHGQMSRGKSKTEGVDDRSSTPESALEQVMVDFVDGEYDVLCATAIVESGLDIPRANTILIDRADLFGLAQLYQLRGRVGRSKERAYCYLIVPPLEAMTDEARARIEALERHSDLGSGFRVASLDLELRGAGDLLGGEQSGSVASVGFDLFVQMLADAVRELRGETAVHEVDPELSFDVTALLPDDYVDEVGLRLSAYKRLASASNVDEVQAIAVEMENRFGPPPPEAQRYYALMALKSTLRELKVLGCEATGARVTLHLREDTPLDALEVGKMVHKAKSPYKLTPDMRLTRRFDPPLCDGIEAAERVLAELPLKRV